MNILDRYGIKEVADVTFYEINNDGSPKLPVLYLDTLKVTTIEQTAEETEARGGKGNAALIAWDYGKEINVTIEDALFSAKSMAIMFGNGTVTTYNNENNESAYIMKTEQFTASSTGTLSDGATTDSLGWKATYLAPDGKEYTKVNAKFFTADGNKLGAAQDYYIVDTTVTSANFATKKANLYTKSGSTYSPAASETYSPSETYYIKETGNVIKGQTYFCSYDLLVDGAIIEVSANSFPGTYYVTGDTFARSEASGKDEFFQFIIPKAKVQSENTITLEAEGDPSVFNMNLKVLRPADGVMMKLVKYDLVGGEPAETTQSEMYHNHYLDVANVPTGD